MKVNLQKYKDIIESLHEGIIIHDDNFNILYANKFITDLLGYNSDEILKLNILNILDTKNQDKIKNIYKDANK